MDHKIILSLPCLVEQPHLPMNKVTVISKRVFWPLDHSWVPSSQSFRPTKYWLIYCFSYVLHFLIFYLPNIFWSHLYSSLSLIVTKLPPINLIVFLPAANYCLYYCIGWTTSFKQSIFNTNSFSKLDFKYLLTHLLNKLLINPL